MDTSSMSSNVAQARVHVGSSKGPSALWAGATHPRLGPTMRLAVIAECSTGPEKHTRHQELRGARTSLGSSLITGISHISHIVQPRPENGNPNEVPVTGLHQETSLVLPRTTDMYRDAPYRPECPLRPGHRYRARRRTTLRSCGRGPSDRIPAHVVGIDRSLDQLTPMFHSSLCNKQQCECFGPTQDHAPPVCPDAALWPGPGGPCLRHRPCARRRSVLRSLQQCPYHDEGCE